MIYRTSEAIPYHEIHFFTKIQYSKAIYSLINVYYRVFSQNLNKTLTYLCVSSV